MVVTTPSNIEFDIFNDVVQEHPQFAAQWQVITEAVCCTLFVSSIPHIMPTAQSPALMDGFPVEGTVVGILAQARQLLDALYHDAWLETYLSATERETVGLPVPDGLEEEELMV